MASVTAKCLPDGRIVVPDNRWDLVRLEPATATVSVVIPYYEQPRQLASVLEALTHQTYPSHLVQVVVADDGSVVSPEVEPWASRLDVTVVRQEDRGFRAAAARNLGAGVATGTILCFLDADTVPTPDYIASAVRLPALAPDVLAVGRRKHADLSETTEASVIAWMAAHAADHTSHAGEPAWLVDGYTRTSDLLEPGWDGYKYMLSAVMTCSRELFFDTGGFDESFVRYGGEDWEFANRAFMMGAVFAHVPDAVAWHDGPDWALRAVEDRTTHKNDEALALAPLITDPSARQAGLRFAVPDIVVYVSVDGHSAASLSVTVASALAGRDSAVWVVGDCAPQLYSALGLDDSRVRLGLPSDDILSRCRFVLEVSGRVEFSADSVQQLTEGLGPGQAGQVSIDFGDASASVTMWSSRARHRYRRWATHFQDSENAVVSTLFGVARRDAGDVGIAVATAEPWLSW